MNVVVLSTLSAIGECREKGDPPATTFAFEAPDLTPHGLCGQAIQHYRRLWPLAKPSAKRSKKVFEPPGFCRADGELTITSEIYPNDAWRKMMSGELDSVGHKNVSPEEALDLWRLQHPVADADDEDLSAVQEALTDMENGDEGVPLQEFDREFRGRHGLGAR